MLRRLSVEEFTSLWSEAIVTAAVDGTNEVIVFGKLVEDKAQRVTIDWAGDLMSDPPLPLTSIAPSVGPDHNGDA